MRTMSRPQHTNQTVPLGIILLGLTPAIMVLLPWDFGPDSTAFRAFMRGSKLTTTVVEFLFVLLAMVQGFSPVAAILALPRLAKAGLSILVFASIWTTAMVAEVPIMAAIGMIKFFAHFMFALAMTHQLTIWTMEQRRYIWPAIGLSVVGYCLLWGVNIVFYHPVGNDWARLVPTLTIVRWVGFYSLAIFCAGIALLPANFNDRASRLRLAVAILFGTTGLAIAFWTGTRAAVGAIMAAAILSSLILPIRRQLLLLTLLSAVLGLAIAATLPVVQPYYGIERMIGASVAPVAEAGISSGRLEIWTDMLGKVTQRPIMGWGIDQFRYSFPAGPTRIRHPHNGLMQLVFSTGLLGVLATLALMIAYARKFPRKLTHSWQYASIAFAFGALPYGLLDGFFYFTYSVMILVVALSCLVAPMPPAATDR